MPQIFDNIKEPLLPALSDALKVSDHADFCVGYFNLRGWRAIGEYVDRYGGGEGQCCRLLIGMNRTPKEEIRAAMKHPDFEVPIDNQTVNRLRTEMAMEFMEQTTTGTQSNAYEADLKNLVRQIKDKKVIVKLHLRYPLHAKLYLLFRPDPVNPSVGYLGSSNLTIPGLLKQGELNIDVLDSDACNKLSNWFEERWNDRWCIDISNQLEEVIAQSWAREKMIPPYHIYLKIAYHLSMEARSGQSEFRIPDDFGNELHEFQKAAVQIAAHHLNTRNGVLLGDVVGLGKTLMATALARIFEDDQDLETLIVCPKNLIPMWNDYKQRYRLRAHVLSLSNTQRGLENLRRHRIVIVDESHNLRNREGKRYLELKKYIESNDCKCILLSATPYNKSYLDLSNQLRLFVPEDEELGIRPERYLREVGEKEFAGKHQTSPRTLTAFEQSEFIDDWRELMRLYMVRRTRSFVQKHYASTDPSSERKYLLFDDGRRSYFPKRVPKTVKFDVGEQYLQLFDDDVVDVINSLALPRCGLGNYVDSSLEEECSADEQSIISDLSRAGKRLVGFNRINLFKRLESSGHVFLQSIERHILRNYIYLHAIGTGKELPIGVVDGGLLDVQNEEDDSDDQLANNSDAEEDEDEQAIVLRYKLQTEKEYQEKAKEIYEAMTRKQVQKFRWIRSTLFLAELKGDIESDNEALFGVLDRGASWDPQRDEKINALERLLLKVHADSKVLVFTQFADTAKYLKENLEKRGVRKIDAVTGSSDNPTAITRQFSPMSNEGKQVSPEDELRVLVATDLLSEGQNLQDCAIVVNYDIPWAIVRLSQRVGRIDRIGQRAEDILCYSFLPEDGVEAQLKLRARIKARLGQNAELVGTDESFFEDEERKAILDLYNERTGILDGEEDTEVDLSSYAYQIWNEATKDNQDLKRIIEELPPVVYSAKGLEAGSVLAEGALVYLRSTHGQDSLVWIDREGNNVTENQFEILRVARCSSDTPAVARLDSHHDLVKEAVAYVDRETESLGGQLGRPSGVRNRIYERLKSYSLYHFKDASDNSVLKRVVEDILKHPLQKRAGESLGRQLKAGISDESLARLVMSLWEGSNLCQATRTDGPIEHEVVCSLGLVR